MATDEGLADLLRTVRLLLLDFDGPVTALMADGRSKAIADSMRDVLRKSATELPSEVQNTTDPILVLRYARKVGHERYREVEAVCVAGEVEAATKSPTTPGIGSLLNVCLARRVPIAVVSNNSADAIGTFLHRHGLSGDVAAVVGRPRGYPEAMKPAPNMLNAALGLFGSRPRECLMFGDSISDVDAAARVGVPAIGFAKTPVRGLELLQAGAAWTFVELRHLVEAWPS